jgi:site-specific DNA recombinase
MLRNEKYVGRWVWNKSETRRDPRSGRRRQFPKPESDWIVTDDEALRIVPPDLWQRVQERLAAVRKTWPGGAGKRGFDGRRGSQVRHYPAELLSGAMVCGRCGGSIVKASGKNGGYYGCLAAAKSACDNKERLLANLWPPGVLAPHDLTAL